MKQYHEPIQVEVGDDGLPYSFRWRNRAWNVISVTDRWVLQAGWWRSGGTEKWDYVLVEAEVWATCHIGANGQVVDSHNLVRKLAEYRSQQPWFVHNFATFHTHDFDDNEADVRVFSQRNFYR